MLRTEVKENIVLLEKQRKEGVYDFDGEGSVF